MLGMLRMGKIMTTFVMIAQDVYSNTSRCNIVNRYMYYTVRGIFFVSPAEHSIT